MQIAKPIRAWWKCLDGEPYRLLFPFGALVGVFGVMLWPAYVYGWIDLYPGLLHARIMIQGFFFSFIAGFMLSALPHVLEVNPIGRISSVLLTTAIAWITLLHTVGHPFLGDVLFACCILALPAHILPRWRNRKDLPPPGFLLAAFGLISAWAGAVGLALLAWISLDPRLFALTKLLHDQAFILFPVLGIGVYLLPRMAGVPNRHAIPRAPNISAAWIKRARVMIAWGLLLLLGFVLVALDHARAGFGLIATVFAAAFISEASLHRTRTVKGTVPKGLLLAIFFIAAGYAIIAAQPMWRMAYIHIVFITGSGLLTLLIGTRVMLGHSGHAPMIYMKWNSIRWVIGLLILAMATRVSADLIPSMKWSHYAYAAITWAVTVVIWLITFSPYFAKKGDAS